MKKQIISEEVLKMQKRAGIITEGEYKDLKEKMEYEDFKEMIKPFVDLAKDKKWVWNSTGDSWFDASPGIGLYHSSELETKKDGEYKGEKTLASKHPVVSRAVQSYRDPLSSKQADVIMQADYDNNQVYFYSKDKTVLDLIKNVMNSVTKEVGGVQEKSSTLISGDTFEPVKYYSILLRKNEN